MPPYGALEPTDALIIVDVQNDFCPGGALPVEQGSQVVPVLNEWIEMAQRHQAKIVASRDWHPTGHISFQNRGGPWPVHCVQNTAGAQFHPDLRLPNDASIVSKGMHPDRDNYSAFDETDLEEDLKRQGIRRLWVGGLAQDVCVRATVLDGLKAGFDVHLILPATRPVSLEAQNGQRALEEMREAGARILDGD